MLTSLCPTHTLALRRPGAEPLHARFGDVVSTIAGDIVIVQPEHCLRCHPASTATSEQTPAQSAQPVTMIDRVAALLTGEPDPAVPVKPRQTLEGDALADAVCEALERDHSITSKMAPARPAGDARDLGDLVADALERGGV